MTDRQVRRFMRMRRAITYVKITCLMPNTPVRPRSALHQPPQETTMASLRVLRAALLGTAAIVATGPLAGCASNGSERATGQVIDDASITTRVKAALAKEEGFNGALDVNVTTYRGTVQLSGFVASSEVAKRAADTARGVDGVRSVKNDIIVTQGNQAGASSGSSH
jgi:osmotically-inducible protein OsmY